MADDDWLRDLRRARQAMERAVCAQDPELLPALEACLAVVAIGSLGFVDKPIALMLVGQPGEGKTEVLSPFMIDDKQDFLAAHFLRSDDFTPASLVSHCADKTEKQLQKIDMLPQLKGRRTLVTKEMAPFFHGRKDVLSKTFALLASVLDGRGHLSNSGVHGQRGYPERIIFEWLGATTPLEDEGLDIMASAGPRILFYEIHRRSRTTDELADAVADTLTLQGMGPAVESVRDFLRLFLQTWPPDSYDESEFDAIDRGLACQLALWAQVVGRLRASVRKVETESNARAEDQQRYEVVGMEQPERVLSMLKAFAFGNALSHLRKTVTEDDLAQLAHIALSSGYHRRGHVLRALLQAGGSASTTELEAIAQLSKPTVLRAAGELEAVSLAHVERNSGSQAWHVSLALKFADLCQLPPA